ncbi:MAG: DUF1080 domain-containing protein [Pseudomonadota bacterium]|nr:DUF1080 domain-containing protein [Pseudomonadota bacterium]
MKRVSVLISTLVMMGISGCTQDTTEQASGENWTTLFDGSSFEGWKQLGDANWRLDEGTFLADSGAGFLVSESSYGDFHLKLEFWIDPDANSGIFIRCSNPNEVTPENSYEVNIFDKRPDPTYRTGGIVDFAPPLSTINSGGQWNTYEIIAEGPRLFITLNGTVTVDIEDSTHAEGPFALQYGTGVGPGAVRFRNVEIMPLQ